MSEPFVEHEFLSWLRGMTAHSGLPVPIGDDAALVTTGAATLVAVDTVIEGSHLEAGADLPERLARKALRVNISDIAAMGGRPETAFVGLGLPRGCSAELARRFTTALLEDCARFGIELAGGDTVVGGNLLFATLTLLGQPIERPVRRNGARPGDWILVTGSLGGSILGKHENFEPRVEAAAEILRLGRPSAMADVSDGFLRDLMNIAQASGCGALVRSESLPISAAARELALGSGRTALDHALNDGEDFELIVTMAPEDATKLLQEWKIDPAIVVAGEIVDEGLWLEEGGRRRAVDPGGFDHGRIRQ